MIQMQTISSEYKAAYAHAWNALRTWRSFLICIDGLDHSGKSSLGRFLSWQMGMPCIETDLYLKNWKVYDWERLGAVLHRRLDNNRPVIMEGVGLLHTLEKLELHPDFIFYMENETRDVCERKELADWLGDYAKTYTPKERANYVLQWRESID